MTLHLPFSCGAVLVQQIKFAACVVCKSNIVDSGLEISLDRLDCGDLVVTLGLDKLADGLVDIASTVRLSRALGPVRRVLEVRPGTCWMPLFARPEPCSRG